MSGWWVVGIALEALGLLVVVVRESARAGVMRDALERVRDALALLSGRRGGGTVWLSPDSTSHSHTVSSGSGTLTVSPGDDAVEARVVQLERRTSEHADRLAKYVGRLDQLDRQVADQATEAEAALGALERRLEREQRVAAWWTFVATALILLGAGLQAWAAWPS